MGSMGILPATRTALGTIGSRGLFKPAPSHVEIAEFGDQPRQAHKAQLSISSWSEGLSYVYTYLLQYVSMSIYESIHLSIHRSI